MHEDIPFSDLFENIASGWELRYDLRFRVTVLSKFVVAIDPICFHQVCEIKRPIDLIYEIHAQGEFFH